MCNNFYLVVVISVDLYIAWHKHFIWFKNEGLKADFEKML